MPVWGIITHLGSVIAFVNAAVALVRAVIAAKGLPHATIAEEFVAALRGIFDSGLIPLPDDEVKALDSACDAILAQLRKP